MSKFENSPPGDAANKLLEDAKSSFKSCIDLEGKPASGETPDLLVGQQWWQERLKAEEEKKKAAESKTAAKPTAGAGVKGGPAAGRGAPAPRGRGAATTPARGGPAGRSGPARGGATAPARGGARGAAAGASRGGAATTKAGPPAAKTGSSGTVKAVKSGHNCTTNTVPASTDQGPLPQTDLTVPAAVPSSEPSKKESPSSAPSQVASKPAPLNKKRYHPRLGLARAMRASGDSAEAKKYYSEVIAMAPEVHDAYIESAEMLTKSDPLAAVDIYSKFPVPEEPSFDDAYIFGEIMRLLMKHEKYDDPRLAPNMIAYGRVMGIGALEKHVNKLEELFKADLLKTVYAGVNRKDVDDPDLQAFFKFKCWI